jgi:hypothetical protein
LAPAGDPRAGRDRRAQLRSGELGHAPGEVDPGPEAEAVGGQGGGGEHVADVAGTPAANDLGGGTAHGRERSRHLADRVGLAAGHVEGAPDGLGRGQGEQVGPGHVGRVDEVAALQAVLEHRRGAPAGQGAAEDGRHPGIGGVAGHPRPVDVVVAQGGHRRPAGQGARGRQVLLVQLGGRIDAAWIQRGVFGDRHRLQVGAAAGTGRLEPAGLQTRPRTGAGPDRPVLAAAVGTLAVDDHRAGQHQPLDPPTGHGGQQGGGTQVVVAGELDHVAELSAQADHGRLVADRVDAVQGAVQNRAGGRVGQVGLEMLDVVAEVVGPVGVGTWVQPVE